MPTEDEEPPMFEGSEARLRRFLHGLAPDSYYTYILMKPSGVPFYVGKGIGGRVLQHRLEALREGLARKTNPFKCNTIRQIVAAGQDLTYRIDRIFAADAQYDCLLREETLIARYRRRCDGGTLTNLAAGLGSLASPDPFSVQRHAATLSGASEERPERTALNLFLRALGGVDSVPVKPVSEYRGRMVRAYPSPKALKSPTRRNGLTLAAAALASNLKLVPGVVILPRVFTYRPDPDDWPLTTPPPDAVQAVIENGALGDILKLGLADLIPADRIEDEAVTLDSRQITQVAALLGRETLRGWGLIDM